MNKLSKLLSLLLALTCLGCGKAADQGSATPITQPAPTIGIDQAIEISRLDAAQAQYVTDDYNIEVQLDSSKSPMTYRIIYVLKDSSLNGGGPVYTLDARSGLILNKIYTQ